MDWDNSPRTRDAITRLSGGFTAMLRHCELFGGIGGFSHAVAKYFPKTIETTTYCDIDEQARSFAVPGGNALGAKFQAMFFCPLKSVFFFVRHKISMRRSPRFSTNFPPISR